MDKSEQHMQESLFDEKTVSGDPKEKEQIQDPLEDPSLDQKDPEPEESSFRPEEPKERAGALLKREREAQGVSLQIVHEATKIPMDALRAIEEGYTVRTLSSFYYQGFLKMYAGYLGVDVSRVIKDYKEEELPQHIDQGVDISGFQMPSGITNFFTRRRKRQIVVTVGVLLALFLFVKGVGLMGKLFSRPSVRKGTPTRVVKKATVKPQSTKKESQKKTVQQKKVPKPAPPVKAPAPRAAEKVQPKVRPKAEPAVTPKTVPEPVPSPVAVAPTVTPVSAALLSKAITLTVRAKQNSWLRVKADGNVVFQSTLRLGAVETWAADDEIEISGKNIDQLEFELNGKMIGTLGRKDRNAKKVIITKNGLSVQN